MNGSIPASFGSVPDLRYFELQNNALSGEIPVTLTALSNLNPNLGYNKLTSTDAGVLAFLAVKDPDWAQTQTVKPIGMTTSSLGTAVSVGWNEIFYTEDGGYYEVSYALSEGGPYTVAGNTIDKEHTGYAVTGLIPNTTYYLRVRTFTPAHDGQSNDLWSDYTPALIVTTGANCQVPDAYATIQSAINDSSCLGIDIRAGYYPEQLSLWRDVYLHGQKYATVVDAQQNGSTMTVSMNVDAIIDGLIVQGGSAPYGAGLRLYNSSLRTHVTVIDTVFHSNVAELLGGAIFNERSFLTLRDVYIQGNSADQGGGIAQYFSGGMLLERTTMLFNNARLGGAVLTVESPLTLNHSWIDSNTASENGGGIYQRGRQATISATSLNANFATNGGGLYLHNGEVALSNSSITGNSAEKGGGAYNHYSTLTFENGAFAYNGGNFGAGLYSAGSGATTSISNASLHNNTAGWGGAIYMHDGTLNTLYVGLTDNKAWNGGGLYVAGESDATVAGTSFVGNHADNFGGAVTMSRGTLNMNGVWLGSNSADVDGGGIYTDIGTLYMFAATLDGNTANINGGGLYAANGSDVTISASVLANNSALSAEPGLFGAGGAVAADNSQVEISNSFVNGNSAQTGGGGFANNGTVAIFNTRFEDNQATYGGALRSYEGQFTITDSAFVDNVATSFGGALFDQWGVSVVSGSTFDGNAASSTGGALYHDSETGVDISNSTFSNNQAAVRGSALSIAGGKLTNVTIAENTGAASVEMNGATDMVNTIIVNSAAVDCSNAVPNLNSLGANLDSDGSCNLTEVTDLPNSDPLLESLADNGGATQTHALQSGSPAVDAGDMTVCQNPPIHSKDQRGFTRIGQDGNGNPSDGNPCDIGAFERQNP